MVRAAKAFVTVLILATVVFAGLYLAFRRYEVALFATSLAIYVSWEYFEVKEWFRDELGCISLAMPIVVPIALWLIFKSYIAPLLGM